MEDKFTVSLKAEPIFEFGGLSITNSMITTVIVVILLSVLVSSACRRAKVVPGRWQGFWELIIDALLNIVEGSMGRKAGRVFFPLLATFFIYILFANWFSLLPGVGSIGKYEQVGVAAPTGEPVSLQNANYALVNNRTDLLDKANAPTGKEIEPGSAVKIVTRDASRAEVATVSQEGEDLTGAEARRGYVPLNQLSPAVAQRALVPFLRAPNADLNMTLAMALITIILAQILAIRSHGLGGYIKEFFPKPYWMDPLLTPIEIVGQFARLISLTIRLFGNVFAGEALLAIILKIAAPTLFIFVGLELFFGLIQALVFLSLSAVYLTLAITGQEGAHGTNEDEPHHDSDSHLDENARYPQQSELVEKQAVGAAR